MSHSQKHRATVRSRAYGRQASAGKRADMVMEHFMGQDEVRSAELATDPRTYQPDPDEAAMRPCGAPW